MVKLTTQEVCDIAAQAVRIFSEHDLRSCLFGSIASWLHGLERIPNDVDLVVFTTRYDQEELKQLLVFADRSFYLAPAATPGADYLVLWYDLIHGSSGGRRRRCKVDILLPVNPNLTIPVVPHDFVEWCRGPLPRMPLIPLLLVKLQGWLARRNQDKEAVDAQDVFLLLELAVDRRQHVWQDSLSWMPRSFTEDATGWIDDFIEEYPKTEEAWRQVGFNVCYQGNAGEIDSD
ncbi:hypothetical protein K466DRAFT_653518 [Polyporus arcularius HHB13444]|uniref:Nucleotidyltransferase domain-containing protein n=1 Tax=Polyporus arcularius HHB13444 TaxID=1314778 RepID=A0A5C3PBY9_9APHY|nr:hypothetical protein K466DRAFT_653518 [Polyporus arcularius HHB13444]